VISRKVVTAKRYSKVASIVAYKQRLMFKNQLSEGRIFFPKRYSMHERFKETHTHTHTYAMIN